MPLKEPSQIFRYNCLVWKIFGIWSPESGPKILYKWYSISFFVTMLFLYNLLLLINLLYTPRKIDVMVPEVIFFFTEMAVTAKVITVLLMRKEIQETFTRLDSDILKSDDETSKTIVDEGNKAFKKFYIIFLSLATTVFLVSLIQSLSDMALPVCKYYFLADDVRDKYFLFLFIYQTFGIYVHMLYNVHVDTYMAGLIWVAILQIKILKHKLSNLRISESELLLTKDEQEKTMLKKMNTYLRQYDFILSYCQLVQRIINVAMFVQFGVASAIICVVLYGLVLATETKTRIFMVLYLVVMSIEIIVPGFLGSELTYEGTNLVPAAYNCDWTPRTEMFKRNLRLFVERANKPILLFGMKMFPLSLGSVTSIMKTAYSFFALLRSLED